MKNFLFATLLLSTAALARIDELKSYKNLNVSDLEDALVVFDIDNTLLRPDSMIGTHQWGDDMRDYAIAHGANPQQATDWQLRIFADVQEKVKVVPTEKEVLGLLRELKARGIPHFALTARPAYLKARTLEQLKLLRHDFASSFPAQQSMDPLREYYQGGVIFSGTRPKGELMQFIATHALKAPKRIVFIDDRRSNLDSVEASLRGSGIELQGFRYGGVDAVVRSYDRALADLEYSFYFDTHELLSDSEARSLLGHREAIVAKRFEVYQADQGPLVEATGNCEATSVTEFRCPYRYDGDEASISFEVRANTERGSLYFGDIYRFQR